MQFDKNTLDRLLALDDDSFKSLVLQISEAVGADKRKTAMFTSDISGLKKVLGTISPSEAEALLKKAGKEKSEEILDILNNQ